VSAADHSSVIIPVGADEAARLRDSAEALRKKKEEQQRQWRDKAKEVDWVVDEEVIAADMTDKSVFARLLTMQKSSEHQQRLITSVETIAIVEHFEIVEIEMCQSSWSGTAKNSVNMSGNGLVAR